MRIFAGKIKKFLFKTFWAFSVSRNYVRMPAVFESIVSADPEKLFVLAVAFNEPELIAFHHRALEKFCRDEFEYFIIDNSNRQTASEAIRKFCTENRVNYVRLPKNPGLDGSMSHGFALNWAYHNLIMRFRPRWFGIMDSDLFPTKPFAVGPYLKKNDEWGVITERRPITHLWRSIWYLWAGCAFFRFERFRGTEPDFLPAWGVDTGGKIRVDAEKVKKLPEVYDLHRDWIVVSDIPADVAGVSPAYAYGAFVHLAGVSWKAGSFDLKRRWIERLLEGSR